MCFMMCLVFTHVMYFVIVTKSVTEVVHDVLSKNSIEVLWTNHVPEDPPGDGDQPHDDERHGDDVVQQVAAELAATSGEVVAAFPSLADVTGALVDCDPQDEQDPNTQASSDQEPRHVGLRGAVGVGFSIWISLSRMLMLIL